MSASENGHTRTWHVLDRVPLGNGSMLEYRTLQIMALEQFSESLEVVNNELLAALQSARAEIIRLMVADIHANGATSENIATRKQIDAAIQKATT